MQRGNVGVWRTGAKVIAFDFNVFVCYIDVCSGPKLPFSCREQESTIRVLLVIPLEAPKARTSCPQQ